MRKRLIVGAVCLMAVLFGVAGECRAETVEQQVVLEGVESGIGVPEEILVDYEGRETYVPVKSARVRREYWVGDFEFPILFYVYDAEYYELGDERIPRQEDGPILGGYEDRLLEALGLDKEDYVIESVMWDRDAYVNEEGIECRDAVARGRKRVRDYEVVYAMEAEPEEESVSYPDETQVMADAPGQVKRVTDMDANGGDRKPDGWTVFKKVTVVTVALAALLLLIGLILLCMRLVKRYREKKKEKREINRKDLFDYCE